MNKQVKTTYILNKSNKRLNLDEVEFNGCSGNDALNVVNNNSSFTILQRTMIWTIKYVNI